MNTQDIKKLIPSYCSVITTKEVAKKLGITTKEAYKLCCDAVEEGWLYRLGYKVKGGGYDSVSDKDRHLTSLTWQNVQEPDEY